MLAQIDFSYNTNISKLEVKRLYWIMNPIFTQNEVSVQQRSTRDRESESESNSHYKRGEKPRVINDWCKLFAKPSSDR